MKNQTTDKATAGTFSIMAELKSYDISKWLYETPSNIARALFETGANLESENSVFKSVAENNQAELEMLLTAVKSITDSYVAKDWLPFKELLVRVELAKETIRASEKSLANLAAIQKSGGDNQMK